MNKLCNITSLKKRIDKITNDGKIRTLNFFIKADFIEENTGYAR